MFYLLPGEMEIPCEEKSTKNHSLLEKTMRGIQFGRNFFSPFLGEGIDRFERQNDISVNVLGLDGKEIVTLRKTREKKENHVILFKLKQGEK